MTDNKPAAAKQPTGQTTGQDDDPEGGWISYPEKVKVTQEVPQSNGTTKNVEVDDILWHRVPVKDWPAYEKAHGF